MIAIVFVLSELFAKLHQLNDCDCLSDFFQLLFDFVELVFAAFGHSRVPPRMGFGAMLMVLVFTAVRLTTLLSVLFLVFVVFWFIVYPSLSLFVFRLRCVL